MLRVGFVASAANELTRPLLAGFARRRPGWRVQMSQAPWTDPTAGLADRSVDVALLRLPVPGQERFACQVLLTEPHLVGMPADHPLAALTEVPFTALLDEPFIATPAGTGVWRDYWLALDERGGLDAQIGAEVSSPDEWLQAISNGLGVSLTPQASARFYARPGLAYRPVTGIGPSHVALPGTPTTTGAPSAPSSPPPSTPSRKPIAMRDRS